ncbi:HU family DNA-binding protein [Cereibacter johrii]|uniref:HU family DNA-binding protein n=1 Tax=Cereibacter johrii TaxID=445629 RepID=UPI002B25F8EF|nr:HU family DNA-binding protein [Cereibacter johrii]MEA5160536.1 HU family DNA-binding protein [Cereibacter johrii]
MTRVTKSDLVGAVAENIGASKLAVQTVLDEAMRQIIAATRRGETIALQGFGTFKPRHRAARVGRNPRTGEAVEIAASTSFGFTASRKAGV